MRHRNSLIFRLMLVNFAFLAAIILFLTGYFLPYIQRSVLTEKKENFQYCVQESVSAFQTEIGYVNELSHTLIASEAIRRFELADPQDPSYIRAHNEALSTFQMLAGREASVKAAVLQTVDGQTLVWNEKVPIVITAAEIAIMEDSHGYWFWSTADGNLSFCRLIRNTQNLAEHLAYLKIELDQDYFLSLFSKTNARYAYRLALVDSNGHLLLGEPAGGKLSLADHWTQAAPLVAAAVEGIQRFSDQGTGYVLLSMGLGYNDLYIIGIAEDFAQEYNRIIQWTIGLILLMYGTAVVIQSILYKRLLISPINRLLAMVKSISDGNYQVCYDAAGSSEINQLARSVEKMAQRLTFMRDAVYYSSIREKDSEIKALQAEINPHFLYNTLDAIYWMIELKRNEDAARMVQMLSTLFRMSLKRSGNGLISLAEEMEHLRCYIGLEELRFQNRIHITLDVQSGLEKCQVLKLVLQPFVENALQHGISKNQNNGQVSIAVYAEDDVLYYYICDNGAGMETEAFQRLLTCAQDGRDHAIYNVYQRIRLKFGQRYGIAYHTSEGGGCTFVISQPVLRAGEAARLTDENRKGEADDQADAR